MRPCQRPTNQGVSSRMKPARQTSSMRCRLEHGLQRALERLAVLAEAACDRRRAVAIPAARASARPARIGTVRDDERDLGRIVGASFAASISAAMLEPRPEIRTATRFLAIGSPGTGRAARNRRRAAHRPSTGTTSPSRTTFSPAPASTSATASSRPALDHRDHADPAVEGAQHLRLGDRRRWRRASGTPAAPARAQDRASTPRPFGSTRGMLSGNPPPVMCASALIALVSRIAARHDFT